MAITDQLTQLNTNIGTINNEVNNQATIIAQIKAALAELSTEGSGTDLEALGALCDWQIMTDSNSLPLVSIRNYHPSYYLLCELWDSNHNPWWDYDDDSDLVDGEVVIPPGTSKTFYRDDSFGATQLIHVDNVRWVANV